MYHVSLSLKSVVFQPPTSKCRFITLATRSKFLTPEIMATYGTIGEYKDEETWTQYVERLDQYFLANDIKDEKKKRAILLSVCGSKTYTLIRDLLQPKKPGETDLKDILDEVSKHYSPTPSEIVERFKFHNRKQADGESVAEFIAGLRKLTEHCKFGETIDDMMRDRLVCGIKEEKIQRRLLAEPDLTYKRAVELALAFESVSKNTLDLNSRVSERETTAVHRVNTPPKMPQLECYRCGGRHQPSWCRFKETKCYNCEKKGHLEKMCRGQKKTSEKAESARDERSLNNQRGYQPKRASTHLLHEDAEGTSAVERNEEYDMYKIQGTEDSPPKAWIIDIELCGRPHKMELDTGATRTIISQATYNQLRDVELTTSKALLSTYTGQKIPVLGKVTVPVTYEGQKGNLSALVVEGEGPNLLGGDWLQVIKINWEKVFKIKDNTPKLAQVLNSHSLVFEDGLGTLKGTTARIYVDTNAEPKFCKARPCTLRIEKKGGTGARAPRRRRNLIACGI